MCLCPLGVGTTWNLLEVGASVPGTSVLCVPGEIAAHDGP